MQRGLFALVFLAACREEVADPLRLELPVKNGHRAALFAFDDDGSVEIYASAIEDGQIEPLLRPLEGDTKVTALLYTETLEELGLAPGFVATVEDGRPLPEAETALISQPGMKDSWSEVQEIDAVLSTLRIAHKPSECGAFEPTVVSLNSAPSRFVFTVPGRGVLIGTDDGKLLLFKPDHSLELLAEGRRLFDALDDRGESILFGTVGGNLVRGTFTSTASNTFVFEDFLHLDSNQDVLYLSGDPRGELYAQTREGFVHRFDGVAWQRSPLVTGRGRPTGIERIGPALAVAAWGDCLCLTVHRGTDFEETPVPANSLTSNGISAVFHDPSWGSIAGSFIGEVFEARTSFESWTKIEGTYAPIEVTSIARYRDHYVYSDERSVVIERTATEYCEPIAREGAEERVSQVAVYGDDLIMASNGAIWWTRIE